MPEAREVVAGMGLDLMHNAHPKSWTLLHVNGAVRMEVRRVVPQRYWMQLEERLAAVQGVPQAIVGFWPGRSSMEQPKSSCRARS